MTCPLCQRPTTRMVYRRSGKCCPQCADPNFIRLLDIAAPRPDVSRIAQFFNREPPISLADLRCVITPNTQTIPPVVEPFKITLAVEPDVMAEVIQATGHLPCEHHLENGVDVIKFNTLSDMGAANTIIKAILEQHYGPITLHPAPA